MKVAFRVEASFKDPARGGRINRTYYVENNAQLQALRNNNNDLVVEGYGLIHIMTDTEVGHDVDLAKDEARAQANKR